ncbi:hypothetical protein GCM10009676_32730 [Prauserella halophila]|uniref:Excreted virulence factor EspC (Type VII ESX diderm) n=1 Tax=Prauserella halophila TaxID=185641 RepID=A0ABP4GZG4_9PSEU|nr:hypothetical protein [Prauserella halophila]MCP2238551.1 hypothetical protein [Prauserella halophila]
MSGVNAPQGYTADQGSMSNQATRISDAAASAQEDVSDVGTSNVGENGFGKAHADFSGDYTAGIQTIGEAAQAMCSSLTSFAGTIGAAAQQYGSAEDSQAQAASQAGSGL